MLYQDKFNNLLEQDKNWSYKCSHVFNYAKIAQVHRNSGLNHVIVFERLTMYRIIHMLCEFVVGVHIISFLSTKQYNVIIHNGLVFYMLSKHALLVLVLYDILVISSTHSYG